MRGAKVLLAGLGLGAGWLVATTLGGCCDCADVYLEVEPGEYQVTSGKEGLVGGVARVTDKELTIEYQHAGSRYSLKYALEEGEAAKPVKMLPGKR